MDGDFGSDGLLERLGGAGVYAVTTITAAGKAILDDANAAAQRTTLGLGTIATQAANSVALTGGAIDGTTIGVTAQATIKGTTIESTSHIYMAAASSFYIDGSGGTCRMVYVAGTGHWEFYINGNLCGYIDEATGFVNV